DRRRRALLETFERPGRGLRSEHLRAARYPRSPVPPLLRQQIARVKSQEQVILTLVRVQFRRPDADDWNVAPHILGSLIDDLRPLPHGQILAGVSADAATG